jgi:hypothetical protein
MAGEKGVRVAALRKLGMSPAKITKHNARHMLRSLVEVIRMAGYAGLAVGIDDLEILAGVSSLEEIRYTKMRREDAYESIRELIDEIDTLSHIMFVFAFDRDLLDDEAAGFKSYQALWMRVQNEIESRCFNLFSDIVDLDKMAWRQHASRDLEKPRGVPSEAQPESGEGAGAELSFNVDVGPEFGSGSGSDPADGDAAREAAESGEFAEAGESGESAESGEFAESAESGEAAESGDAANIGGDWHEQ